ncbi:uncharacterized protein LOC132946650 [Metopolophium dirhodum]|uniref:uncharacterized protein LOC132946650 n=1 Tax=Metopolophium dirhodum TaxID=44670 RepID=UPI00298FF660|nr:uncharacterized protein LOC132946650 [Metopolophium dirhodum]
MASRVSVNIFYVCDSSSRSMFKGVYAIKTVSDKIEEIYFNLTTRVESRNDIDMIVKSYSAITVYIIEKDIILRLCDDSIKIINPKRSRGVSFEVVKGVMARVNLFDGVDATMYCSTKEIGPANDALLEMTSSLPDFAVALSRDEIDLRYEQRRARKEERGSIWLSTPAKGRSSTRFDATPKSRVSEQKKARRVSDIDDNSHKILNDILRMNLNDDDEAEGELDEPETEPPDGREPLPPDPQLPKTLGTDGMYSQRVEYKPGWMRDYSW